MATSRTPSTGQLGLEHTDIDVERGSISVDNCQRVRSGESRCPVSSRSATCARTTSSNTSPTTGAHIVKANLLADIALRFSRWRAGADLTEANHHAVGSGVLVPAVGRRRPDRG